MIYCPKCGTANREGSRFCNECGSPLPSGTGLRCPMCGEMNPIGSVYCNKCNARLVPLTTPQPPTPPGEKPAGPAGPPPVRGLSLPTIPSPEKKPPVPEIPTGEGEGEDWLAALRATAEELKAEGIEEEAPPPAAEVEPLEIPDWLAELRAAPPEEAPAPPFEVPPVEEERAVPDWLAELEAAPPEEAPAPPFEVPPAEERAVPDWLAELEAAPSEEAPAPPFEVPPVEEERAVPEWLAELEAAPPSEEGGPPVPPFAQEEIAGETPPKAPVFISEEGLAVEEGTMPEWLAELAPGEVEQAPAAAPPFPLTEPLAAPPAVEGLVPAEIPKWLEGMRPSAKREAPPEEPVETRGVLEGLRGTLPASRAVEMPEGAAPSLPAAPSAASIARAELLQELLSRPPAPARPLAKEQRRDIGWVVQRAVVALLLILSIVAPIAVPIPLFSVPSSPAADRFFNAVQQNVGPDEPVLVAFEYSPAEADEMERVAEPVLRHLLGQGARLIIVSTRPEGPALAERLLARLRPEARQVANLGYQPGQTAGVQGLLAGLDRRSDLRTGLPAAQVAAMEGVHTVADVAMVVVLAAQPDELRAWVEQVTLAYPDLPLVAGISARVEPLAAPYLDPGAGQLRGTVAGLAGAAAYEAHLGAGGRAGFYLNSLGLAQLTVVGLMLVGAAIFLVGGRR